METNNVVLLDPSKRKRSFKTAFGERRAEPPALLPIVGEMPEAQEKPAIRKLEVKVVRMPQPFGRFLEMSKYELQYTCITKDSVIEYSVPVQFAEDIAFMLWLARRSVEQGGVFKAYNFSGLQDVFFEHLGESPWVE